MGSILKHVIGLAYNTQKAKWLVSICLAHRFCSGSINVDFFQTQSNYSIYIVRIKREFDGCNGKTKEEGAKNLEERI